MGALRAIAGGSVSGRMAGTTDGTIVLAACAIICCMRGAERVGADCSEVANASTATATTPPAYIVKRATVPVERMAIILRSRLVAGSVSIGANNTGEIDRRCAIVRMSMP